MKETITALELITKLHVLTRRTSSYGRMALAYRIRSNYNYIAKSVKEKSILQFSCVKVKDATCRQARSIQDTASTYSVHPGNVPQGQRGTQVDAPWHCYKCSTECSTEQGKEHSPAQRHIQTSVYIAGIARMNMFARTPGQYISATLRYGGRGLRLCNL